jgi:ribonuclease P protein component
MNPVASTAPNRLVRSADFERVLQTRSRVRSAHFAVHHVPDWPFDPARRFREVASHKLSTAEAPNGVTSVDNSHEVVMPLTGRLWLGAIVPKRHAKRAVTRSLLKRQIRAAVGIRAAGLKGGLWVVRLCAPFDRSKYPSAASDALRIAARTELETLMAQAARRCAAAPQG